ncbi:MAG: hypothetical protein AAB294_06840, partial [Pseudomonadota bacterium]
LGMPPAFNLSQDQTLHLKTSMSPEGDKNFYGRTPPHEAMASATFQLDDQGSTKRPHKLLDLIVKERDRHNWPVRGGALYAPTPWRQRFLNWPVFEKRRLA